MTSATKEMQQKAKAFRTTPRQCFLVENLDVLQTHFRGDTSGLPYGVDLRTKFNPAGTGRGTGLLHNAGKPERLEHVSYFTYSPEPDKFLSNFLVKDAAERQAFIHMKPHLSASLTPKISLFKITNQKKIPFVFDNFHNELRDPNPRLAGFGAAPSALADMMEPAMNTRGVGIKSCQIDLKGDNIATSSRIFEVQIEYFFSSLEEVFKVRGSGDGQYSFRELIAKRAPVPAESAAEVEALCKDQFKPPSTRVYLEFGYADPEGPDWENNKSLRETVINTRQGMYLDIHNYKLGFSENGNVTLSVSYNGYIEKTSSGADVFELGLSIAQRKQMKDLQLKQCKLEHELGRLKNNAAAKKIRKDIKNVKKEIGSVREYGYQSIMARLLYWNKVYISHLEFASDAGYITSINKRFKEESLRLTNYGRSEFIKNAKSGLWFDRHINWRSAIPVQHTEYRYWDEKRARSFESALAPIPDEYVVKWVYFGDIFNQLCFLLGQEDTYDGGGYILGHLYSAPEIVGDYHGFPLAGFPISVDYFGEWFQRTVIRRGTRGKYSVGDFINDMLRGLVGSSFASKCNFASDDEEIKIQRPYPRFMSTNLEYDGLLEGSAIGPKGTASAGFCGIGGGKAFEYKSLNPDNNLNATQQQLIWAAPGDFSIKGATRRNPDEDAKRGIYHLVQGTSSGIVKKIDFKQTELKFARESHMAGGGSLQKSALWAMYNCNVTCIGTPFFKPGMLVKIISTTFNQASADEIGLGGYFRIIKVFNKIQDGKFETELECMWEARGS